MTKICCTCKKEKNVEEFSFRSPKDSENRKTDFYQSQCKDCHKLYVKKHYHENKKIYYDNCIKHKEQKRIKLFEHLQNCKCIVCGENDPIVLDFNHLDPSKKSFGVYEMINRNQSWENILKEICKCEVLCSNCHRRKTAEMFGYTRFILQQNSKK